MVGPHQRQGVAFFDDARAETDWLERLAASYSDPSVLGVGGAAAPVGATEARVRLVALADEVVFVHEPDSFGAVGAWYADFAPTSDDEVRSLLQAHGLEGTDTPRYRPQPA